MNENKEVITFLNDLLKGKEIGVVSSGNPGSCPSAMPQGEILREAQDDSLSPHFSPRLWKGGAEALPSTTFDALPRIGYRQFPVG